MYTDKVMDHFSNPRNVGEIENADGVGEVGNASCGDIMKIFLKVEDNVITDVAFQGQGRAISVASASMMTELLTGCPVDRADEIYQAFHRICTGEGDAEEILSSFDEEIAERLHMLSGVREFPMRVKCATLAWHTMDAAVKGENEISTE